VIGELDEQLKAEEIEGQENHNCQAQPRADSTSQGNDGSDKRKELVGGWMQRTSN